MKNLREDDVRVEGTYAAYVIAGILLAATFWASPSIGMLFLFALIVCAGVCAAILAVAAGIAGADKAATTLAVNTATRLAEKPKTRIRVRGAGLSRAARA